MERLDLGEGPREKLVDCATVDDPRKGVGEIGVRVDVSISEAMTAQLSAPPSEPAKSAFLRVRREV